MPSLKEFLKKEALVSAKNKKLIVIVGQTASGKSALAVRLAKKINGEIISADSRQVYRGLNLASGKITKKEMAGIKHYCLDLVSLRTVFTARRFKTCFASSLKKIQKRGKTPILVGGTGFYIDAALGIIDIPKISPNWPFRKKLEGKSLKMLFNMLKRLDSRRALIIEPKNKRRIIRAIEIAKTHPQGPFLEKNYQGPSLVWLGIKIDPQKLRKQINQRLNERLEKGMITEIKKLHNPPAGKGVSWRRLDELGLDYRWVSRYLRGLISKEEMTRRLENAIWRYGRRQMTWFKRNKNIRWITIT